MNDEHMDELRNAILNNNKMLYCMKNRPCNETCMCWKLECGNGWLHVIDEMSKSLEALNYAYYPRFRVRIQADQVKEKFGLLHFYYSIVSDPPRWMCLWHKLFQKLFDNVAKLDFKKMNVVDHDAYDDVVEEEIATKEEFDEDKKNYSRCENVEFIERDGKYIKKTTFRRCMQTHFVATQHRFLFKLLLNRYVIENLPMKLFNFYPSHKQRCIKQLLYDKAQEIVKKAEDDCFNVCEHCGRHISDDRLYSPRCTTRVWIQYLCKECADKTKQQYIMNDAVWENGKIIMTKEEYAKEKAEIDARFKAAQDEEIDDEDQD